MNDDVKWIRIKVGMFDGNSFKRIKRAKIDGVVNFRDKLTAVWFELLDLGGKINNSGFLINDEIAFRNYEDIAIVLDREENEVRMCIEWYVNNGMMEIVDDIFLIRNWSKYQNEDGLKRIQEQNAERQRKFREKQKQQLLELTQEDSNVTITLPVTLRNALDIDKDKDIRDINISSDVKQKDKPIKDQINEFSQDNDLKEVLNRFVEMRNKINKKLTNYAFSLILKKLVSLSSDKDTQIAIVNQSIEKSWQSLFPLQQGFNNNKPNKQVKATPEWYDNYEKQLKGQAYKEKPMTKEEQEEAERLVKDIFG